MSNESSESKKKRGPRWPRILVGLVVFLALLLAVVQYALGPIVRTTAEKLGPSVLGTRVDVTNAHMRVLSGLVRMEGVVVGPPEGFDANVFEMQNFRVDLDTASLFGGADEPILIRDITIEGPFVTYELKGIRDNLHKLLANLGADDDGEEKPEGKKEEGGADGPAAGRRTKRQDTARILSFSFSPSAGAETPAGPASARAFVSPAPSACPWPFPGSW